MEGILFSELRQRVEAVLWKKQYKAECIKRYTHTWEHVHSFMDEKGFELYSRPVGDSFLSKCHNDKSYEKLTHRQKERVRHVEVLSGYMETGMIPGGHYRYRPILFEGKLGQPFNRFIEEESRTKKASSITRYRERIEHLYLHLHRESKTVRELDIPCMLRFLNQLNQDKSPVDRNSTVITIRIFMRYLCSCGLLINNRPEQWMSILKLRQIYQPKIPSVYTQEEVEALICAVDRGNPRGKRDYAMILLAARYGLRISDIIGMRYCNLDWEQNRIIVFQQKTGKKVVFPLSEEIGSAVIDYLRYGRPKVELPYIFITAHAPYRELSSGGMSMAIKDYFRIAGVNCTNRKHGPHSLRHSLASNLLKSNETLPVISEILGHSSTETIMEYLRVDINLLRRCTLEVPFVSSSFYNNLYGN
ncbi:MAG: tyrosine-type recombinase/integrase [Prevotella sp.]|jgi:site-specific recombinase XerD|nr:tyrosine-type recombinase/integrase [Prevotella sp.]